MDDLNRFERFLCEADPNIKTHTIMKKTYIIPALTEQRVQTEMMIAGSITNVGGNSGIGKGDGEVPTEADVKGNYYGESIFD